MPLPVPWVALREGELIPEVPIVAGGRLFFMDEGPGDRSPDGYLWVRSSEAMDGEPIFGAVHPRRQRRCMEELLCQVCGDSARDGLGATFILPIERLMENVISTTTPPVCRKCAATSLELCPHLGHVPHRFVKARDVKVIGVHGSYYHGPGLDAVAFRSYAGDQAAPMMLARQRVVVIRSWAIIPVSCGERGLDVNELYERRKPPMPDVTAPQQNQASDA